MRTLHLKTSISRPALRLGSLFVALALTCFALSPAAYAQCPSQCDIRGNTATGSGALQSNTTGAGNTATGDSALGSNTTGNDNTASGVNALFGNKTGSDNTATGEGALESNTTGSNNTAAGGKALLSNNADNNTATGFEALISNTTGPDNTATGANALQSNKTGGLNTATGFDALTSNTTGNENTANGAAALSGNTTGNSNTATGEGALLGNKTGSNNTATGLSALESNTAGSNNTADGVEALLINTGNSNTGSGYFALINNTSGSNNIAVGANAGFNLTTGSNNIDVGNKGVAGESAKIRIGTVGTQKAAFIAGIHGVGVTGLAVFVSSSGQLGTAPSSARFKKAIKPMDKSSEAILALQPVTFRYKEEIDPDGIPQFGLVAEQVEKVNPDLVARDADGKVNTVRYEAVNAMLLNEFLKEHRKVQEQQATIAELKFNSAKQAATVARQQKQIEALTSSVQKVSEKIELNKTTPQLVADRR
jgi:trimeric autotransporter adhesin